MANLELRFGFERGMVQVTDGTMFRPLGDAIARWDGMVPPQFNFPGTDFQILYELPSDKFVIVHYPCCHNRRVNVEGKMADIWVNDAAYWAEPMKATDAVRMLVRNEFDIPKRFDRHLTAIKEEDSILIAELAPRPISYWADGDYVGEESRRSAHTVDAIAAAREIVDFGIRSIQQIRHNGPPDGRSRHPLHLLESGLFATYPVDYQYWWGPKDCIPPATVGILGLSWPSGAEAAQAEIRELQNMLFGPLSVLNAARTSYRNRDRPTEEERLAGEQALLGCVDGLERSVLNLRRALDVLQAPRDIPAEVQPTLKRPPDSAFLAFRFLVLGMKQEDVVARLLKYGHTATQGTVSRWKDQVWKWLEACNVFPPMPEPIRHKPPPIDPAVIDQGANRERRTTRQRQKKKEE